MTSLEPGQLIPFAGDRAVRVGAELADAFRTGDHLVVVHETGDLLHIPRGEHDIATQAVSAALDAFAQLQRVDSARVSDFFDRFARALQDPAVVAAITNANAADVADARSRGRSTGRLALTPAMLDSMITGLHVWRDTPPSTGAVIRTVEHPNWTAEELRAPLGVVGFVFEGRPNVFADAAGVLRTGNTAVLRIASDALGTATAIMEHALRPALTTAGLPEGAVQLLASRTHAAGWALFADSRLGLAVARGSGSAVAQLGAVARQHGVAASLHGTGGAWMVVAADADPAVVELAVLHSLDRKVCNTLNVCCVVRNAADELLPCVVTGAEKAAATRGTRPVLHATASARQYLDRGVPEIPDSELGTEWEWEDAPELSLVLVDDIAHAVTLFNEHSPRFAVSLVGGDDAAQREFYETVDAPFVGNGFTRWVDGQFAFDQPELGLSNWQSGRLLARGGVLSGDSVHTVRARAVVSDHSVHR